MQNDEFSGHHRSRDTRQSEDVPVGQWTDVRVGQRTAEGTYVDDAGVLRDERDNSVVAWHFKPRHCTRRLTADELVYHPITGAPWCPECWPTQKLWEANERRKARRLAATGSRAKRREEKRRRKKKK